MVSRCDGFVSAGEVVHLWERGVVADELCGCGRAFSACPFWTEVGRVAFGGWDRLDADEVVRLQRKVDRNRYIFFMLAPRLAPRYGRDLIRYVAILDRVYRALGDQGPVVVDSSKHASTAFLLRRVPSVDLRVVHLVRDSRGVAYSLLKKVRRPEVVGGSAFMFRASPWKAATQWSAFNLLFTLLRSLGTPTVLMRYERLVEHPRRSIGEVLGLAGRSVDPNGLGFIDGRNVDLGVDHMVAGNPMRFEQGPFELRVDEVWRASMRPRDRSVTTLLTWPLLVAYGYLGGQR
jgi:hypothetical protein